MRRRPRSSAAPHDAAFLPEAELEVLACLHRLEGAEASAIREALLPRRPMTHASVATLLRRLEGRKLVGHRKAATGKAFVYFAIPQPEQTYRSVIRRVAERVFDNDKIGLVSSLFGAKPPTPTELAELRQLLDDLESRGRAGKRGAAS